MTDNEFWLGFYKVAGWTVFGVATVMAGCTMHSDYQTAKTIEATGKPLEVYCSSSSGSDDKIKASICLNVSTQLSAEKTKN